MKPRHRNGLIAGGLAAVAVIFWATRIIGLEPPSGKPAVDLLVYMVPMTDFARQSILSGELPLWNPYQLAGHPFIATGLAGFFYPPNLLLLPLPAHLALEANVILHIFLAGIFTFAFARSIGLSIVPALASALTFMLSGYVASRAAWFTPALDACVWLPLGLLAAEKLCSGGSRVWAVVLSIVIAMPMLTGWWQVWMYSTYAIGAYCALRLVMLGVDRERRREIPALSGLLLLCVVVGVGLAAIQLLPSLELGQQGPRRPGGLSVDQMLPSGRMPPLRLLREIVDAEPGHPRSFYLGMVALALIPLSIFNRAARARVGFFGFMMIASVVVAVSTATVFFDLYRLLPATSWFRIPQRIAYLYAFSGAMLTGFGVDVVRQMAMSRDRWPIAGVAVASAAAGLWWFVAEPPAKGLFFWMPGLAIIGYAALARSPKVATWSSIALVLLVGADLVQANRNANWRPIHHLEQYDSEGAAFDFVRSKQELGRTYFNQRVGGVASMHKQAMRRGIFSITDYEPLSSSRVATFYRLLEEPRFLRADDKPFVGSLTTDPSRLNFRLLNLLSVKFVTVKSMARAMRESFAGAGWRRVWANPDSLLFIYRNPHPIPRVYLATAARVVPDEAAALAAIRDPSFDPWREVILEEGEKGGTLRRGGRRRAVESIADVEYDREEVRIHVDVARPSYLVLTDAHYPGWVAYVDGRETPILRANYLFRALPLERGSHEVVFRYQPTSFRVGAAITSTSAAALVISLIIAYRRGGSPAAFSGASDAPRPTES